MRQREIAVGIFGAAASAAANRYNVPSDPDVSGTPWESFMSYSIEFSSFPEFAGNLSAPNTFSDNLLNNLAHASGDKSFIRVGGNTQDYAIYNASLDVALVGVVNPDRSPDYPTTIHIGPSYFESYHTWPGCKYSHGFNLALGANTSKEWVPQGWNTLVDTVPLACKALGGGKLYTWEYGNEPNLYKTSAQGPVRPPDFDEEDYVFQWLNGTKEIRKQIREHCPGQAAHGEPKFMALAYGGTSGLDPNVVWSLGLDKHHDIELLSAHNYISGAESLGVTLQGTLMNHSSTTNSVDKEVEVYRNLSSKYKRFPPLVWGEHNSLYNQGRPGLSNTFGAALWGVDFNLYSAVTGFKRVHMHMGTNYRYQSWQPVDTNITVKGTKPPFYGNMAVASMVSRDRHRGRPVSISSIPLKDEEEAAYAAHYAGYSRHNHGRGDSLARIIVINMRGYNTTVDGAGLEPVENPPKRKSRAYTFGVDGVRDGCKVGVQRLMANGSDAITGVTFDGWSYNYELDEGKPVRLHNVTVGEKAVVKNGEVTVHVPDSSAALLIFDA